ncbi:hypothetical protein [Flavivirga sp. 57AJ16]|uniref:hypothetical protein n=1 Tax=Flavivirga sp. 57AJ16 TaxID=3025307 RepID=UPI002366F21E|nr:hypothetical protein [Flavivirga sp. 57AJ16]MDD7885732.1 hypothetical protein [Flavivirga sp. 57AJ16]
MFSQNTVIEANFGIPITKEIDLPDRYNHIMDIVLQELPRKLSRDYFNDHNEEKYENDWFDINDVKIHWDKKEGDNKTHIVSIPPLKPNRFYRIKVTYLSSESIFAAYLMMHDEKNDNWYTEKKQWMKLIERISAKRDRFPLTYDPVHAELVSYQKAIDGLDLTVFDRTLHDIIAEEDIKDEKEIEKKKKALENEKNELFTELKRILLREFKILNFADISARLEKEDVIHFSKLIKKGTFDETTFSSNLIDAVDFINIYEFYETYLLDRFKNKPLNGKALIDFINDKIKEQEASYTDEDLIPNHLGNFKAILLEDKKPLPSTYPISFETAYKLSLVPDFGYVTYITDQENAPKGGNLFLGVNISLSPSNKNVPLQISKLSAMQRLSIHTGVTIGSIQKDHVRDNFFGNYSLLLGGSYKVLTQGTRVNFGGLFYKKIDAINGSKSITVHPYVGLSIDLDIKRWLQTIFPKIKI